LRDNLIALANRYSKKIIIPKFEFCGDNAAMIAFRGAKLFEAGLTNELNFSPYPGLPENYFS
jgi:N6-L-threonylcarbamoyladenine synthase